MTNLTAPVPSGVAGINVREMTVAEARQYIAAVLAASEDTSRTADFALGRVEDFSLLELTLMTDADEDTLGKLSIANYRTVCAKCREVNADFLELKGAFLNPTPEPLSERPKLGMTS